MTKTLSAGIIGTLIQPGKMDLMTRCLAVERTGAQMRGMSYPRDAFCQPLGVTSVIMETGAKDTLVGSSYMFGTTRDRAWFGQLLLQSGLRNGGQILPPCYTGRMFEPGRASNNT